MDFEVVLFGASGYSGLEFLRLASEVVVAASSDSEAGRSAAEFVPSCREGLSFTTHKDTLASVESGQYAVLATPAQVSADLVPALLDRGLSVVDVSGAFRLEDAAAYEQWYGFAHPAPDLLPSAHYGLIELFDMPAGTRLVANPGCYATAAILATAPLLDLCEGPIRIDGKSGTTGAGKKADKSLIFSEVAENLRAYRVGQHQHTPEIERALRMYGGKEVPVSFTAHLIPMRRGILVTAYLSAKRGVTRAQVTSALKDLYDNKPFVRVVERPPETSAVQHTGFTEVGAFLDGRTGTIIAFAAIDNLVKGAAGQALANVERLARL